MDRLRCEGIAALNVFGRQEWLTVKRSGGSRRSEEATGVPPPLAVLPTPPQAEVSYPTRDETTESEQLF